MVRDPIFPSRMLVKMIPQLYPQLHSRSLFLSREDQPCDPILLYQELLLNMGKIVLLALLSKILSILKVKQSINQLLPTVWNLDTNSSSSTPCTKPSLLDNFFAAYRSNRVTVAVSPLSCNRCLDYRPPSQHQNLIGSGLSPYRQTFMSDPEVWKDPSRIQFSAMLYRILQQ